MNTTTHPANNNSSTNHTSYQRTNNKWDNILGFEPHGRSGTITTSITQIAWLPSICGPCIIIATRRGWWTTIIAISIAWIACIVSIRGPCVTVAVRGSRTAIAVIRCIFSISIGFVSVTCPAITCPAAATASTTATTVRRRWRTVVVAMFLIFSRSYTWRVYTNMIEYGPEPVGNR